MIEKIQIIPNDFKESFENMPLESIGRLTLALFRYANDEDTDEILKGDRIAEVIFPTLKAHIERHEEYRKTKAESGRKGGKNGGAPIGNSNASKTKQNKAEQSKTKQNKPPNPNPNPNPNPINKRQYGVCENVLLTEEEYQKIVSAGYTELIDELSLYISSKGAKYKSHYSTILAWARRREKENKNKVVQFSGDNAKNQFNRFPQRTDAYDYDKLIKN